MLALETGYCIIHIPKSAEYTAVGMICVAGLIANVYDNIKLDSMLSLTGSREKYNATLNEFVIEAYNNPQKENICFLGMGV